MDWSLVLVSQGISTRINREESGPGWYLLVSAQDGQNALHAIRQYHVENRGWPWREPARWSRAAFDWSSLAWGVLLILFFWRSNVSAAFREAGVMDSSAVSSGQWWRIFTAIMLHEDIGHLATNLSIGVLLLGLALGRFGTGIGLLASFLTGAGGNVVSLLINEKPFDGLGASGMVMGALGLLAAQSLKRGQPGTPRQAASHRTGGRRDVIRAVRHGTGLGPTGAPGGIRRRSGARVTAAAGAAESPAKHQGQRGGWRRVGGVVGSGLAVGADTRKDFLRAD